MRFTLCAASVGLSLMLLCSCVTEHSARRSLPADVPINPEAGRGGLLIVTLQLESGEKLPFIVDTGASGTLFDQSLEPKLGKPLGTSAGELAGIKSTNNYYAAPKLYLGGAPLLMTDPEVAAVDLGPISAAIGRPVRGIVGMNVLGHYCIQLDFAAGKMRFLDGERSDHRDWGKAFPIVPLSAADPRPAVAENLLGVKGPLALIDSGYNADGWLMPKYFQQWTNPAVSGPDGAARSPHGRFGGEPYLFVGLDEKDFPSDAIALRFLARHLVTQDFPNHTLYLRRQSIGPLPDPRMAAYKPIRDREPQVTAHLRALMQGMMAGTAPAGDFTAEAGQKYLPRQKEIQAELSRFGSLVALTLVDRSRAGGQRSYRYRLEFTKVTLLGHFVLDGQNKLVSGETEAVAWKAVPD